MSEHTSLSICNLLSAPSVRCRPYVEAVCHQGETADRDTDCEL